MKWILQILRFKFGRLSCVVMVTAELGFSTFGSLVLPTQALDKKLSFSPRRLLWKHLELEIGKQLDSSCFWACQKKIGHSLEADWWDILWLDCKRKAGCIVHLGKAWMGARESSKPICRHVLRLWSRCSSRATEETWTHLHYGMSTPKPISKCGLGRTRPLQCSSPPLWSASTSWSKRSCSSCQTSSYRLFNGPHLGHLRPRSSFCSNKTHSLDFFKSPETLVDHFWNKPNLATVLVDDLVSLSSVDWLGLGSVSGAEARFVVFKARIERRIAHYKVKVGRLWLDEVKKDPRVPGFENLT